MKEFSFEETNCQIDRNWGSGYPNDPLTKQWMSKNFDPVFGYPSVARFSWKPIQEMFKKKKCELGIEKSPQKNFGDSNFYFRQFLKPYQNRKE
jgi:ribonuclease H2 subunit A